MVFVSEIHIDDERLRLRRDRASFEAARALVQRLVDIAEARGLRLALRFRWPFAQAARAFEGPGGCLARWEAAGHELGVHAHRRGVLRAARALRAAGVQRLRAVVPGLIRSDRAACVRTLRSCAGLGLDVVSDQPQIGAFAWSGLTPWRPAPDLSGPGAGPFVFVDVSVNPFHWGLLVDEGGRTRQTFGLRAAHFERLLALLDAQLRLPRPHPVCTFLYTQHEHQHARSLEDLRPDEQSLQAWDEFLGQALQRPVRPGLPVDVADAWRALEVPAPPPPAPAGRALDRLDPLDLRHDGPSWLAERLRPNLDALRPALAPLRALRVRVAEARRRPAGRVFTLQVGDRALRALRVGPAAGGRLAVVLSHAGALGGTALFLEPFGLRPEQAPDVVWWAWDRSGTGATRGRTWLAPGNPWHAEEAEALFAQAAAEGLPTGWLSFSGGVLAPLLTRDRAQAAFLVDGEAPACRLSLAPRAPGGWLADPAGAELAHLSQLDDAQWSWREPYRLLARWGAPYHRLQAEVDHVHGRCAHHARVMLEHAPGPAWLNGAPWDGELRLWPGPLHAHGDKVAQVLLSYASPGAGASR